MGSISVLWSLFIASFAAATVLPLSSEIALTAALYKGVAPVKAFAVCTLGNCLGSLFTFTIASFGKVEWLQKYLRISHQKILDTQSFTIKYGSFAAFLCFLPIFGDIIAVTMGFFKYPIKKFILYMSLGKAMRYGVWIALYLGIIERIL